MDFIFPVQPLFCQRLPASKTTQTKYLNKLQQLLKLTYTYSYTLLPFSHLKQTRLKTQRRAGEKTISPCVSGSPALPQVYKLHAFTVGSWPWNSHLVLQGNKRTYWKQMYGHPETPWLSHTEGFLNRPTGHTAWFQRGQESQSLGWHLRAPSHVCGLFGMYQSSVIFSPIRRNPALSIC